VVNTIAVLGAGMMGSLCALELARRGRRVVLFDRNAEAISEASLVSEGKIHRGFVYAADPSFRTAQRMLEGAAAFEPVLGRYVSASAVRALRSEPFDYLVHRDSQVPVEQILRHFARISDASPASTEARPVWRVLPADMRRARYDPDLIVAAFETDEIAIDPRGVAALVRAAVSTAPRLTLRPNVTVHAVEERRHGYFVATADGCVDGPFSAVVNTLWANRAAIDREFGLAPSATTITRVKCGVTMGRSVAEPCTCTVILGPFGDVVRYPSGRLYLSWYPDCMLGSTTSDAQSKWETLRDRATRPDIASCSLAALSRICLPLRSVPSDTQMRVTAGAIVALGHTDIDDPRSRLHERYDVGVRSCGNFHSVDTGKYTLAPLFAVQVADRIAPA
jgi:glycine/D-amino acid oxidase-like deaminating enzyme